MAIRRDDARPLHAQVADDLRRRITKGEFTPGQRLPSLRALTEQYEVAEQTVHIAVRELQREGVLESTTGRGTFVRNLPEEALDVQTELDQLRSELRALADRVAILEERHGKKSTGSMN